MIDPKKVQLHPFAAAILYHLKDQEVEIATGETKTTLKLDQYDYALKNIMIGKVRDAMGDCLMVEIKGTIAFLNVWSIKTIVPCPFQLKNLYQDDEHNLRRSKKL